MKYKLYKKLPSRKRLKGVTLVELSVVIAVLIALVSVTTLSGTAFLDWKKGLEAGETLKGVYQAQKLFLADNPTTDPTSITEANIIPYLPNSPGVMPTITGLDGGSYTIKVNNADGKPTINGYADQSPPSDNSVWDAGK